MELRLLRRGVQTGRVFAVRGPAVTIGRYSAETGPVDIDLGVLPEHERLRMGLPHVRIGQDYDGWWVEPMTMFYPTLLNGTNLSSNGARLSDGSTLTLGDVQFLVCYGRRGDHNPPQERPHPPCLRLKRAGAWTGVNVPLNPTSMVFGRASPLTGDVDCDLSHLPDSQRVHLGRRHARFFLNDGRWFVEPIGRAPVCINRQPPLQRTYMLRSGDEVSLGNLQFTFMGSDFLNDPSGDESEPRAQ
jgi:hypothetical protein